MIVEPTTTGIVVMFILAAILSGIVLCGLARGGRGYASDAWMNRHIDNNGNYRA
jgi:hypothetical protein